MTTAPDYEVTAYFDLPATGGSNIFTLDDPVKGILDSAYVLAGDIATDITSYVRSITTNRGASRAFDQVRAGTCTIELNNSTRAFDQLYSAGPFFGNIVPGKRISVKVAGATIFDGQVESWKYSYGRNNVSTAVVTVVDSLAVLATKELSTAWTPSAGQLPGARLASMLDRAEVAFGSNRALDAGVSTLMADTIPQGTNALVYAQLVTRTDFGRFFASRNNVLTFRDRRANLNSGAQATFVNDGTGLKFASAERLSGIDFLYNYVTAGRRGGSLEIFTNDASIAQYGIRALPDDFGLTDLIVDSDGQAYDYGLYIATNYSLPEDRFSSFTFRMHALDGAAQNLLASLDISSLVRGVWTPDGVGSPVDRYSVVEGISHQIQRNSHTVTVNVGDAVNASPFILDDPIFGVLDGPGVLVF